MELDYEALSTLSFIGAAFLFVFAWVYLREG